MVQSDYGSYMGWILIFIIIRVGEGISVVLCLPVGLCIAVGLGIFVGRAIGLLSLIHI